MRNFVQVNRVEKGRMLISEFPINNHNVTVSQVTPELVNVKMEKYDPRRDKYKHMFSVSIPCYRLLCVTQNRKRICVKFQELLTMTPFETKETTVMINVYPPYEMTRA